MGRAKETSSISGKVSEAADLLPRGPENIYSMLSSGLVLVFWFGFLFVWFLLFLFVCLVESGILKFERIATIEDVFQFRFPEITFEHFFIG